MVQRAIWRKRSDDPQSVLGMLIADRAHYAESPLRAIGCLGLIGTVVFLFRGELLPAAISFGITAVLPRLRMRRKSVVDLLTVPLPAPAFPGTVEITSDGAMIGWDRGVVTFLDGWLYFEGRRTSFSLSRSDVRQRRQNEIELDGSGVRFFPDDAFSAGPLRESGLQARFAAELDRWYRIDSAVKGISILPPNTLHRSGVVRAWADVVASIFQFAVTGAVFWAFAAAFHSIVVCFVFGFSGDFVGSVMNFRKVRRLRREECKQFANVSKASIGPS